MVVSVIIDRAMVQLWDGGPYWATTNIGAEEPEEYGYYFWWGDTVGYKRENDKWVASDGSNLNFSFGTKNTLTYGKGVSTLKSEGWITSGGVLTPEHDAAHVHWGGNWRMPTKQEFDNLNNKCDWIMTAMNGINGYVVRGYGKYASNSIFLPGAGCGYETSLENVGSPFLMYGYYWSSVQISDAYGDNAHYLNFQNSSHGVGRNHRHYGHTIRPVQGVTK